MFSWFCHKKFINFMNLNQWFISIKRHYYYHWPVMKRLATSMLLFWIACFLMACGGDGVSGQARGAAANVTVSEQGAVNESESQGPELFFSVSRSSVQVGETFVLTWNSAKADACFASGAWNGDRAKVGEETITLGGTGTYNFRLVCNAGAKVTDKLVSVVVSEKIGQSPEIIDPSVLEANQLFKWLRQAESA